MKDSYFAQFTSDILRSGLNSAFRLYDNDLPSLHKAELDAQSLWGTWAYIHLFTQSIGITVESYERDPENRIRHKSKLSPEEWLRYAPSYVDVDVPVQVEANLKEGKGPMQEAFRELGRYLTLLGTELVNFNCWDDLCICLPQTEVPFDSLTTPNLPMHALVNIRHLKWSGHPTQLVASWFPFTPSLLQSLETLTITSNITIDDCIYLFYHITHLKTLSIKTIRSPYIVDPVIPRGPFPSMGTPIPCLETLTLESDEDISPLLRPFDFPSLRSITFLLTYHPSCQSDLQDLENLNWSNLKDFTLYGDISDDDKERITSRCSATTLVDIRGSLRVATWY